MEKFWIVAILLFLLIIFLFWKISIGHFKKEYGKKMWKLWGTKTFYWQGAILFSCGITTIIMFILKEGNILVF